MTARRVLPALLLGVALIIGGGCAQPAEDEPAGVEVEVDVPDCDAEDRRRKEQPDCGRTVNGRYVEWSWVKGGKTRPPAGWSPAREPAVRATQAAKSAKPANPTPRTARTRTTR